MSNGSGEDQGNAGGNQGGGGTDPKTDSRTAELQLPGELLSDPENPPSDPPPKTDSREETVQPAAGVAAEPGGGGGGGPTGKTDLSRAAGIAVRRRAAAKPDQDPPETDPKTETGRVDEVRRR